MPNPYKLPSYRHVEVGGHLVKAYLVLATDVYGQWSASYHAWLGEDEDDQGRYMIVAPIVQGQPDVKTACRKLRTVLHQGGADW